MIGLFDEKMSELLSDSDGSLSRVEKIIFVNHHNFSLRDRKMMAMHSIPIIYSIWEGFIQMSFQFYIEAINSNRTNLHDCTDELIVYFMENKFKQFHNYPQKNNKKKRFFEDLHEFHRAYISAVCFPTEINTKSNVSLKVLNQLLQIFSIEEFPLSWDIYSHPNQNLEEIMNRFLDYRNTIAHGNNSYAMPVDKTKFEQYRDLIKNLMYEIFKRMHYSLENQKYLKINNK